ncbi:hypothetical protein FRC12_005912 [Ceratobasidium sp. 428]|nr:hypothetical protein FRC12_005912 [Ceratobasidium sp. 428]
MKHKPVTIDYLPLEIFACIFSLSMPDCVQDAQITRHVHYGFVNVCRYWRQIATSTPSLWTHIDLHNNFPHDLLLMLLERGKNYPIDIHLVELRPKQDILSEAILLLKPHIHRVCSLKIEVKIPVANDTIAMVNQWLDYGDPALANALDISTIAIAGSYILAQISQSENSKKLLSSISALRLKGYVFPWDSSIYHNLTSLILFPFGGYEVPISQIYNILAATSQTLVVLKLAYLTLMYDAAGQHRYVPVALNRLNMLNLEDIGPKSLVLLLPLIALPNPPHGLDVALPASLEAQVVLDAFLAQSPGPLATLFYQGGKSQCSPVSLFRSIPCVNSLLILHGFIFRDELHTSGGVLDFSAPHIPNMVLRECIITLKTLNNLIVQRHVRNLRIETCRIVGIRGGVKALLSYLRQNHPALECAASPDDSTLSHPVRQW